VRTDTDAELILQSYEAWRDVGEIHPLPYFLGEANDPPIRYREVKEETTTESNGYSLQISPVPAHEEIIVSWPSIFSLDPSYSLDIFDMLGRKWHHVSLKQGDQQTRISVVNWPPSLYFAVLRNNDGMLATQIFTVY